MKQKLDIKEAQEKFNELISELQQCGGYVEIVKDHHTVAVIIDLDAFRKLRLQNPKLFIREKLKSDWKLRGSVEITEDFEDAAAELSKSLWDSIEKQKL
ncbi:MAG: hypothetical protein ACE5I5_18690 [Candidatus Heimdallarchaeota archaeon]